MGRPINPERMGRKTDGKPKPLITPVPSKSTGLTNYAATVRFPNMRVPGQRSIPIPRKYLATYPTKAEALAAVEEYIARGTFPTPPALPRPKPPVRTARKPITPHNSRDVIAIDGAARWREVYQARCVGKHA